MKENDREKYRPPKGLDNDSSDNSKLSFTEGSPAPPAVCKPWLTVQPSKGVLKSLESTDIILTVLIDREFARNLLDGKEKLEDILVLHIHSGCDFFVTVTGTFDSGTYDPGAEPETPSCQAALQAAFGRREAQDDLQVDGTETKELHGSLSLVTDKDVHSFDTSRQSDVIRESITNNDDAQTDGDEAAVDHDDSNHEICANYDRTNYDRSASTARDGRDLGIMLEPAKQQEQIVGGGEGETTALDLKPVRPPRPAAIVLLPAPTTLRDVHANDIPHLTLTQGNSVADINNRTEVTLASDCSNDDAAIPNPEIASAVAKLDMTDTIDGTESKSI